VIVGAHDTGPLIRSRNLFWLACRASTTLSLTDNHLGRFSAAGVGVSFAILAQVSPSFWLSLLVVAGASA
jgi:hypothetical protein